MSNGASLTTISCPDCKKVFIGMIQLRNTIGGQRPTLIFPLEKCNECEFDFSTLKVESFTIPINKQTTNMIVGAKK